MAACNRCNAPVGPELEQAGPKHTVCGAPIYLCARCEGDLAARNARRERVVMSEAERLAHALWSAEIEDKDAPVDGTTRKKAWTKLVDEIRRLASS